MAEKPAHGTFCWNELVTTDLAAAKSFYSELIGWEIKDSGMPGFEYYMLMAGEKHAAGLMAMPAEAKGVPSHWMGYIAVDDVDSLVEKTKALGGSIIHGPQDIPEVGRFLIIKDPTGAVVSLMKMVG